MNNLGATEVLAVSAKNTDGYNARFEPISFNGFTPKYKILSNYDHLIEPGDYSRKITGEGLEVTLKTIPEVVQKYHYQVRKLAKHLYTANPAQDSFNVWHFLITNIRFKNDTDGFEELRSPARSWRDRFSGIDCDCFTDFAICLFLEMNYMPYANIVAFPSIDPLNPEVKYSHIYTINNGIIVDPVMKIFNVDPPNIVKNHKLMITNVILNGIPNALGEVDYKPADSYESEIAANLMGYIQSQTQKLASGKFNAMDFTNLKKAQYMLFMNALPERELIAELLATHVKDFNKNGSMIFYNNEINGLIYGNLESALNGIADVSEETNEEIERIGQIFDIIDDYETDGDLGKLKNFLKKLAPKNVIKKVKEVNKKIITKVKKINKKVTSTIKKVAKNVLVKYNPAFAIPRAAFLVLVNLNVFNLGFKLSLGYMTQADFVAQGGDASEWQKCVDATKKAENLFEKVGGTVSKLRTAALKGKDRKEKRVAKKTVRKAKRNGASTGTNGFNGLGVTGAEESAAAVAASSTIWGKILAWFKNINWKKLVGKLGKKVSEGQTEDEVLTDQELNPDGTVPDELQIDYSSTGSTGFPIWGWILIAAGVLGIGAYAMTRK